MVFGLLKCSFVEDTSPVSTGAAGKECLQRLLRGPEGMLLSAKGGKMVPSGSRKESLSLVCGHPCWPQDPGLWDRAC